MQLEVSCNSPLRHCGLSDQRKRKGTNGDRGQSGSRKGLFDKIETKRKEAHRRLKTAMRSLEECEPEGTKETCKTMTIAMESSYP